ncbi:MAG: FAD-binding oxidoreductase [Bifidobacteriaceae bacterium]|jgi:D-amino-acid dehydrogenase|nr:FAD-binding oxidoreductase [Bifidobacteriaceae bacterium]
MKTVIVGAGVVGLATAYELVQAGHEVTVVEKETYGAGPSQGNAGLLTETLSFPVPAPGTIGLAVRSIFKPQAPITVRLRPSWAFAQYLLRMALATRSDAFHKGTVAQELLTQHIFTTFDAYREAGLEFEMHQKGSLHIYPDRGTFDAALKLFEPFHGMQDRIQAISSAAEVHELDPELAPGITYGYYAPQDRQVEPVSLLKALLGAVQEKGGQLLEHTAVLDFVTEGNAVRGVVTTGGVLDADQVVIAAGVGSRSLATKLGLQLPLYGGGGYSIDGYFASGPKPALSALTVDTDIAVTPLNWGLRASSGMIVGQDKPVVNPKLIQRLLQDLKTIYPQVRLDSHTAGWAGLRPMSADGVPIIGPVPGLKNAILATGHAMMGVTFGPITAKIVRELIEEPAHPAGYRLFAAERFL